MNRRIIALTSVLVAALFPAGCKRSESTVTDTVATDTMTGTTETSVLTDTGLATMTGTSDTTETGTEVPTTTTTPTATTGTR